VARHAPRKALLKLCLALLLLFGHVAAWASEDDATAGGPMPALLTVTLNGTATPEPVLFLRGRDGTLYAAAEALSGWRIRLPRGEPVRFEGALYYPLTSLPGLDVRLDEGAQAVSINLSASGFETQRTSLAQSSEMPMTRSATGAFVGYDLFVEHAAGRTSVNGAFEAVIFTPHGVGATNFIVQAGDGPEKVTRLETSWTIDRPTSMTTIRIGDAIAAAGPGAVPFRFGGIQFARSFGVQPGFLTMPLLSTQGSAAVASVVDIYVNNALQGSRQVAPGPFEIGDIPVQTGGGDVRIVVRDLLGRETVTEQSYYSSAQLLRRGLHDFSFEAGFIRRAFGRRSNSYGEFMASTSHRFGVTDRLTVEAHAQASEHRQMAGAAVNALVFDLAQIGGSISVSHGPRGIGYRIAGAVERHAPRFSFGVRAEHMSADYGFIGMSARDRATRLFVHAFADTSLPFGSLGFNVTHRGIRDGPDETLAGLFGTFRLGRSVSLNAYARHVVAGRSETIGGIHLSFALGGRRSASAGLEAHRRGVNGTATFQQDPPSDTGGGFRAAARFGENTGGEAAYVHRFEMATVSAEVAYAERGAGLRLSASGAIGLMGGDAFASRSLGQSFATVRVPNGPGVRVYADDHLIGVTGANGALVVPGLRAYEANRIRIDENDLPLDVQLAASDVAVRPFARSGVLVAFDVRRERGVLMKVALEDGRPLPAGARVLADGGAAPAVAVSGGEVYLPGLIGTVALTASWEGGTCSFTAIVPDNDDPQPRLDGLVCRERPAYASR